MLREQAELSVAAAVIISAHMGTQIRFRRLVDGIAIRLSSYSGAACRFTSKIFEVFSRRICFVVSLFVDTVHQRIRIMLGLPL